MHSDPIEIKRVLRKMRGSSQAQLVEAEDGHFYVVKFMQNPQGNRTLINECLTYAFYERLRIQTPVLRFLHLSESPQASSDLCFELQGKKTPIKPGIHLGSQCPVNPEHKTIFDFVPRKMLAKVSNLADFGIAFAIDQLLGRSDARQAIFTREPIADTFALRAHMIDHGRMFGGSEWVIRDLPQTGHYFDRTVYSLLDMPALCNQTIERVAQIGEDVLYSAAERIPRAWFADGDYDELCTLFQQVQNRKRQLNDLVMCSLDAINIGFKTRVAPEPEVSPVVELPSSMCLMPAIC